MMINYLRLIRAPNVVTSTSNVYAGAFIAAAYQMIFPSLGNLILLMICSAFLYATAIIWNDLFDLPIDRINRPERMLPSHKISIKEAAFLSFFLSATSLLLSATINTTALLLCLAILVAAYIYNSWAKHNSILGSLFMGLCRSLNLALGFCVFSDFSFHQNDPFLNEYLYFMLFHFLYIASITYIGTMQEGEISLEKIFTSFILVTAIIFYTFLLPSDLHLIAKILIILLVGSNYIRLNKISSSRNPQNVGLLVKYGILNLVLIDAILTTTNATQFVDYLPSVVMIILVFPITFLTAIFIEVT